MNLSCLGPHLTIIHETYGTSPQDEKPLFNQASLVRNDRHKLVSTDTAAASPISNHNSFAPSCVFKIAVFLLGPKTTRLETTLRTARWQWIRVVVHLTGTTTYDLSVMLLFWTTDDVEQVSSQMRHILFCP